MPAEGKKSVAAELRSRYPAAAWLAGPTLHHTTDSVSHDWWLVDGTSLLPALLVRDIRLLGHFLNWNLVDSLLPRGRFLIVQCRMWSTAAVPSLGRASAWWILGLAFMLFA